MPWSPLFVIRVNCIFFLSEHGKYFYITLGPVLTNIHFREVSGEIVKECSLYYYIDYFYNTIMINKRIKKFCGAVVNSVNKLVLIPAKDEYRSCRGQIFTLCFDRDASKALIIVNKLNSVISVLSLKYRDNSKYGAVKQSTPPFN